MSTLKENLVNRGKLLEAQRLQIVNAYNKLLGAQSENTEIVALLNKLEADEAARLAAEAQEAAEVDEGDDLEPIEDEAPF